VWGRGGGGGGGHLLEEAVHGPEMLVGFRAAVGHHLDDTDDAALVPDRNHHRRAASGWPGLGKLADVPFAVDVVVRGTRPLHDLRDVVEERRLAGDDHLALHAAALAVELHGG